MKRPRPEAPAGIPAGTVQLGGPIDWFSASLQVAATDLVPDEVTRLLGASPTRVQTKGVPVMSPDGSASYTPRFGRWIRDLRPTDTDEWDVTEVIYLLFDGLPEDSAIWRTLGHMARIRVALGLSMPANNREFELDPSLFRFLADRCTSVWFDIYDKDGNSWHIVDATAP